MLSVQHGESALELCLRGLLAGMAAGAVSARQGSDGWTFVGGGCLGRQPSMPRRLKLCGFLAGYGPGNSEGLRAVSSVTAAYN
jgi:hypothetical protein